MRLKSFIVFGLVSLITLTNTTIAQAATGFTDSPLYGQKMSKWCWAASSEMMVKTKNRSYKTQDEIVTFIKHGLVNDGGTLEEEERGCEYGTNFVYQYDQLLAPLEFSRVVSSIDNGWPVLINIRTSTSGHAMVLTGYDTDANFVWLQDPQGRESVNTGVFPASGDENWIRYNALLDNSFSSTTYFNYIPNAYRWVTGLH